LIALAKSIETGINKLELEDKLTGKFQLLNIDYTDYEIPLYRNIDLDSCKVLLSNSLFLYQLKEEIKEKR